MSWISGANYCTEHYAMVPDYSVRAMADEMMDDFSITDSRLSDALNDLRKVNLLLGGYSSVTTALRPFLLAHARVSKQPVRILDVGTGIADIPEYVVRWGDRMGFPVHVVGVDANEATVAYANESLDKRLSGSLRSRIRVEVADALSLPFESEEFDIGMSSMFMHHLDTDLAVEHVRSLARVSSKGLVVNDLHRHPLAYRSIRALAPVLSDSPMFRHDGPISVLRGFVRSELEEIAQQAGLVSYRIKWRWAFRWSLITLRV